MEDEKEITLETASTDAGNPPGGDPPAPERTDVDVTTDEEGRIHANYGDAIDEVFKKLSGGDGKPAAGSKAGEETDKPASEPAGESAGDLKSGELGKPAEKNGETKPAVEASAAKTGAESKRDDDIAQIESKLDPHTSPKAREHFNALKKAAVEARNKAEEAEKSIATLKAEVEERKKTPLPKETEEQLKQLQDTIREIDITRDPVFAAKYDHKIKANESKITTALVENGLDPKLADRLQRQGYSLSALKSYIDMIEKGDDGQGNKFDPNPELADEMRAALRENGKLGKERESEFGQLKASYDQRQQQTTAQQQEKLTAANNRLQTEFKSHVDRFPFLQKPPEAADTDPPAVRKQKEQAITEFNATVNKYAEISRKETSDPIEATISARIGILYREFVVPNLQNQVKELQTQLAEAQGRVKKLTKAGSLTPSVRSAETRPAKSEPVEGEAFGDAVDASARALGILK